MPQKNPPTKIDYILRELSEEDLQRWGKLVRFKATYRELRQFLSDRGHEVSDMNLSQWWKTNRPRGKEAATLNTFAESWEGLEPDLMLQAAAGISTKIVSHLYNALDEESISAASIGSKLTNLTELLKELRQCAQTIAEAQKRNDEQQIRIAGAYEMAEELKKEFKGTPFEGALEAMIEPVMQKIRESS